MATFYILYFEDFYRFHHLHWRLSVLFVSFRLTSKYGPLPVFCPWLILLVVTPLDNLLAYIFVHY